MPTDDARRAPKHYSLDGTVCRDQHITSKGLNPFTGRTPTLIGELAKTTIVGGKGVVRVVGIYQNNP